jgi:hypothetical protein
MSSPLISDFKNNGFWNFTVPVNGCDLCRKVRFIQAAIKQAKAEKDASGTQVPMYTDPATGRSKVNLNPIFINMQDNMN